MKSHDLVRMFAVHISI